MGKRFLFRVMACLYILWTATLRYLGKAEALEEGSLIASYHQNLISFLHTASFYKNFQFSVLISQHADGDLASYVCERYGLKVIRGSSKRIKKKSHIEFMNTIKNGCMPVLILDGPLGPAKSVEPGVLFLAQRFSKPIQVFFFKPKHAYYFKNTWDRFSLPFPFSKIYYCITRKFFYNHSVDREMNMKMFKRFLAEEEKKFTLAIEAGS